MRPGGGAALRLLAAAVGARAVVEIGTGAGVSGRSGCCAACGPDGVLTTSTWSRSTSGRPGETFAEAGFAGHRARLIGGRALDVLPRLTDAAYDLVFCDAHKPEYPDYLVEALRLLRPGGMVAFDNALWHDRVADPAQRDADTVAMRELGRAVRRRAAGRALLAVGDGLLVAVKTPLVHPPAGRTTPAPTRGRRTRGRCQLCVSGRAGGDAVSADCLERVPELAGLVGRQLDDEPPATLERDPHHDAPPLLGDLERTVARPRLHRRHARTPSCSYGTPARPWPRGADTACA